MKSTLLVAGMATFAVAVSPAFAQGEAVPVVEAGQADPVDVAEVAEAAADPVQSAVLIPALTPVSLEILADIGSETSTSGDRFPLRLAKPILVDGEEAIPAGTAGMGEVVHAKKRGGSGAGGELIVAARYLEFDGRQLPLRSMRVAVIGLDQMEKAQVMTALVGVFGMSVEGRDVEIRSGRLADAKTAQDFEIELDSPEAEETVFPDPEVFATGTAID